MRSRLVRIQLIAFAIIAVVGIVYTGVRYVGIDRYFGASGYTVQMQLKNSGGIFSNAEVTYRGVAVGRVGQLTLTPDGVSVGLSINDGAPNIPQDLTAAVANRSAVG
ncbi:MAG: MlaD family protein, partial [Mycobacteriaceae bacterium]